MPEWIDSLLGLHRSADSLTFVNMAARTIVVFAIGIVLVRCADRRFLGRNAGFDVLLGVILGSVLSRAINGSAAFLPTLGAGALLVVLHRVAGTLACRSHRFSRLLKGSPKVLIRDGMPDTGELRRNKISADDLEENLRVNGNLSHAREAQEARLERDGVISVVPRRRAE